MTMNKEFSMFTVDWSGNLVKVFEECYQRYSFPVMEDVENAVVQGNKIIVTTKHYQFVYEKESAGWVFHQTTSRNR